MLRLAREIYKNSQLVKWLDFCLVKTHRNMQENSDVSRNVT